METVDYVITGGGSAGCVAAYRLSEDPRNRVLLLEAGPSTDRFWVNAPAGFTKTVQSPDLNWRYVTEPDPTCDGREIIWNSGRGLGGGSAINGMVYVRGARYDYDGWAEKFGCAGWSWSDVLPYFIRAETFEGEPSQSHGSSGPLGVAPLRIIHPLAHSFLDACDQIGIHRIPDYCEGDIDGAYINVATQQHGRRSSTAASYLAQAGSRPNLKVVTGATVDRVILEEGRARGVVYRKDSAEHTVMADGEVIVSAGTIQSPAILMRSGIGPGEHLRDRGVEVRRDLQGVGRNLHEHPTVSASRFTTMTTYNAIRNPFRLGWEGMKYLLFHRGLLTTCAVHAHAHGRTRPDAPYPDLKLQMNPFCFDRAKGVAHPRSGITVTVNNMFPKTRGEIRLRSSDPADKPVIDYRMYQHPEDLAAMRAGLRLIESIFDAPAFAPFLIDRNLPTRAGMNDDELNDYIRSTSSTGMHAVSTCRMGGDQQDSVVDPQLRVWGVDRLRVIDASIMPLMPSANTNAPAIMIGEKGADMVLHAART